MTHEEIRALREVEVTRERFALTQCNTGEIGLGGLPPGQLQKLKQLALDEYKKAVRNYAKVVGRLKIGG